MTEKLTTKKPRTPAQRAAEKFLNPAKAGSASGYSWYERSTRATLKKLDEKTFEDAAAIAKNKNAPLGMRKAARAVMLLWRETDPKKFAETIAILENQAHGAPVQKIEQTNIEAPKPFFDDENPRGDIKPKKNATKTRENASKPTKTN